MTSNFRVLGAGVWGLAFSDYLLKIGHNVEIFCRDTNLSNRDIKGLALSHISNNNIKSLGALDTQKSNDEINIIAKTYLIGVSKSVRKVFVLLF